ncbi:hypothetical protein C8R46DRAFT_1343129 [Mycena filopes]|nr:hypothetical protein C8R46DRAFT_1343129 [Mycena filopes]
MSFAHAATILQTPLPAAAIARIGGNAPPDVKGRAVQWLDVYHHPPKCFGRAATRRTRVTEVSLAPNPLDDTARVLTMTAELDVTEETLDEQGKLSTGFIIAVMDECLSSTVMTLEYAEGGSDVSSVSLGLNTVFYNPAELGARLRIVSTNVAGRMTSRCEVWDLTRRRLVVTGLFLGMRASARL